jgi:hypothetical protein
VSLGLGSKYSIVGSLCFIPEEMSTLTCEAKCVCEGAEIVQIFHGCQMVDLVKKKRGFRTHSTLPEAAAACKGARARLLWNKHVNFMSKLDFLGFWFSNCRTAPLHLLFLMAFLPNPAPSTTAARGGGTGWALAPAESNSVSAFASPIWMFH